eukprot:7262208-Prymnesium_polylepis.1
MCRPPDQTKPAAQIAAEHGIVGASPAPRLDAVRGWVNSSAASVLEEIYETEHKTQARVPQEPTTPRAPQHPDTARPAEPAAPLTPQNPLHRAPSSPHPSPSPPPSPSPLTRPTRHLPHTAPPSYGRCSPRRCCLPCWRGAS